MEPRERAFLRESLGINELEERVGELDGKKSSYREALEADALAKENVAKLMAENVKKAKEMAEEARVTRVEAKQAEMGIESEPEPEPEVKKTEPTNDIFGNKK